MVRKLNKLSAALLCTSALVTATPQPAQSNNQILGRGTQKQALSMGMYAPFTKPVDQDQTVSFHAVGAGFYSQYVNRKSPGLGAAPLWSGSDKMFVTLGTDQASNPNNKSYLSGDQLGLGYSSTNKVSWMQLDPQVLQYGAKLIAGLEADCGVELFGYVQSSVGQAEVDLQLDSNTVKGDTSYTNVFSYDTATAVVDAPLKNLQTAFAGGKSANIGTYYKGLQFGKIDGNQKSKAQLGDTIITLGLNPIHNETFCWGLAVRGVAPLGNKVTSEFVQQPIFGNGGYFQLGGQTMGHVILWGDHEANLRLQFDGYVVHSFKNSKGTRSFDLTTNGNGSKYLLIADYSGTGGNPFNSAAGTGAIQNLINISTLAVDSSFAAEGDIAVALRYTGDNISVALGYEFFARTKETLAITGKFDEQRYAVMGQANLGTSDNNGTAAQFTNCYPSSVMGQLLAPNLIGTGGNAASTTTAGNRIAGVSALNKDGATAAKVMTSSIFAQLQYDFACSSCTPHMGIHAAYEFSHSKNNAIPMMDLAFIAGISF